MCRDALVGAGVSACSWKPETFGIFSRNDTSVILRFLARQVTKLRRTGVDRIALARQTAEVSRNNEEIMSFIALFLIGMTPSHWPRVAAAASFGLFICLFCDDISAPVAVGLGILGWGLPMDPIVSVAFFTAVALMMNGWTKWKEWSA